MPESVPGSSVKTRIADLLLSSRLADVEFLVGNNGRSVCETLALPHRHTFSGTLSGA